MGGEAYMPHGGAVEDHSMPYRTVPMSNRLAHAPGMRLDGIAGELATAPAAL